MLQSSPLPVLRLRFPRLAHARQPAQQGLLSTFSLANVLEEKPPPNASESRVAEKAVNEMSTFYGFIYSC